MPARHPRQQLRQRSGRRRQRLIRRVIVPMVAIGALVAACTTSGSGGSGSAPSATAHDHTGPVIPTTMAPLPPIKTGDKRTDLYKNTRVGNFQAVDRNDPALVYVPNLDDGTVSVISQKTLKVIYTLKVGIGGRNDEPQHVVPSWDLKTLFVNNNHGNSLTPINAATGQIAGPDIPVPDPYNLYFTPNGRSAIVMAEYNKEIDFYDPHSFRIQHRLPVPACDGVNHADFSPDGSYMIATCEFAGMLVKVNLHNFTVESYLDLGPMAAPQDIKIDPYGKTWYVADMNSNGVDEIDGDTMTLEGQIKTGPEAHGLYPSRNGKDLYVSNRGGQLVPGGGDTYPHVGDAGSVSVIDFATRKVVATWVIPGGGTPDMGNVSADGNRLWLSGRRNNVVYVIDTHNGHLIAEIPVGGQPHGLAVWPLPGKYSLGHTGILR